MTGSMQVPKYLTETSLAESFSFDHPNALCPQGIDRSVELRQILALLLQIARYGAHPIVLH